jgi:hypothetical protein
MGNRQDQDFFRTNLKHHHVGKALEQDTANVAVLRRGFKLGELQWVLFDGFEGVLRLVEEILAESGLPVLVSGGGYAEFLFGFR